MSDKVYNFEDVFLRRTINLDEVCVIKSHPMKSLNVNWNLTRGICCMFLNVTCYMIGCGDGDYML